MKKKWLPIRASKFFDSEMLGECYVTGPEQLIGRTVSANLANLTGDVRQQSVTLRFIVRSLEAEGGVADVVGYEMASSAIRRIVRRGSDRIDESFLCETSDGSKVRIKPMLITKAVTNGAVHQALRKALISNVATQLKKYSFNELINEIITSKFQTAVKSDLKTIYPLKAVELTSLWLLHGAETGQASSDDGAVNAAKEAEVQQ